MSASFEDCVETFRDNLEEVGEGLKELDYNRDKFRFRKKILEETRLNLDASK